MVQSVSVPEQAEEGGDRHQRADARRNRGQILEAAEALFAEQGISVPIDEIALRRPTLDDAFLALTGQPTITDTKTDSLVETAS